jgi:hypothetical protein
MTWAITDTGKTGPAAILLLLKHRQEAESIAIELRVDGPLDQLAIELPEAAHQPLSQGGQVCFPVVGRFGSQSSLL